MYYTLKGSLGHFSHIPFRLQQRVIILNNKFILFIATHSRVVIFIWQLLHADVLEKVRSRSLYLALFFAYGKYLGPRSAVVLLCMPHHILRHVAVWSLMPWPVSIYWSVALCTGPKFEILPSRMSSYTAFHTRNIPFLSEQNAFVLLQNPRSSGLGTKRGYQLVYAMG